MKITSELNSFMLSFVDNVCGTFSVSPNYGLKENQTDHFYYYIHLTSNFMEVLNSLASLVH